MTAATRVPPHSAEAEDAVLGAMLLSGEACATAVRAVTFADLYRPANASLFDVMHELYQSGTTVDPITVADALRGNGLLEHVGGIDRLIGLQANAPGTSNTGHYCKLIVEKAIRRRTIGAASWAIDAMYDQQGPEADVLDLIEQAKVMFAEASVGLLPTEPKHLFQLDWFLDSRMVNRPPWVIPGLLRRGHRAIIIAPEGAGKGLPLDTPIATPSGWTTMGEIEPGDLVFDAEGAAVSVSAVSVVHHLPCYRVTFNDGTSQVCDEQHQWWTVDYQARQGSHQPQVVDTVAMAASVMARGGHTKNHAVPVAKPLDLPDLDLPFDPYMLGAWLGDGTSASTEITVADKQIVEEITAAGYIVEARQHDGRSAARRYAIKEPGRERAMEKALALVADGYSVRAAADGAGVFHDTLRSQVRALGLTVGTRRWTGPKLPWVRTLATQFRDAGLYCNKHIPAVYLRASTAQRLALLQGLMDTDGSVSNRVKRGHRGSGSAMEFTTTSRRLADGVEELLASLGIRAKTVEGRAMLNGRDVGAKWRIMFKTDLPVFRLERKLNKQERLATRRALYRYVASVERVESVPTKCIMVDSPTSTYLAGKAMIPTHNSTLARQLAMHTAQGRHPFTGESIRPVRTLIADFENPDDVILEQCKPIRDVLRLGPYDPNGAWLYHQEGGINVKSRADRAEFEAAIAAVRPELVVLGPLYKMFRKGPGQNDEDVALDVQGVLDDLRVRYGFALFMEHHAPKGQSGGARELVPQGSALWLRWPEYGFKMIPEENSDGAIMELGRFRKDRALAAWPSQLHKGARGGPRPWEPVYPRAWLDQAGHTSTRMREIEELVGTLSNTAQDQWLSTESNMAPPVDNGPVGGVFDGWEEF